MTTKPNIIDVINETLQGDRKQNALAFVDFVKSIKMTPSWASWNSWTLNYKGKRVGYIKIYDRGEFKDDWWLWLYSQYTNDFQELVISESKTIQEFITNNICYCCYCGKCAPGKSMTLLDNELKNICITPNIRLQNPDKAFCDFAKKLISLRREAIANNKVPKNMYIAIKNRK